MEIDSVENFARLIAKSLEEYEEDVETAIEAVINEVAEETLQDLENNPIIPANRGKYKKGFYLKNVYKGKGREKGYYKLIVANKEFRIGHLLERSHLTRDGTTRTRAFSHWKQAQEIANTLPDKIKEVLE